MSDKSNESLVIGLSIFLAVIVLAMVAIVLYFICKAHRIRKNNDVEVVVVKDVKLAAHTTDTLPKDKPKSASQSEKANVYETKLKTAKKTGVLDLSETNLQEFPELLDLGTRLRLLDISKNNIKALPDTIKQFTSLKKLSLDSNRLTELPEEMGSLNSLEVLSANNNRIKDLPNSFSHLSHLRSVSLSRNQMTEFPVVLCELKTLDYIDLSDNQIKQIPNQIKDLNAIELNLNLNRISSLPPELCQCHRLKVLRLDNNTLPISAITKPLLSDSKIAVLTLEGNGFDARKIRELDGYEAFSQRQSQNSKKLQN